jgi:hypothetical protein
MQEQLQLIQDTISNINTMLSTPKAENYLPILHTPLTVHNGISVTGNFKTSDINRKLSYITVLRQENSIAPSDGLGFAWYSAGGTEYNVYLVDSNPLTDDIMFTDKFVLQNVGENSFLAAASGIINPNTKYSFRMDIGQNYSLDVWIWDFALGGFNESLPNMIHVSHGGFVPRSNGTHFGIAVLETNGAEWYYDDLQIASLNSLHTVAMFELKAEPSKFPNGTTATIKYHGYGMDGTTAGINGYIWNRLLEEWELFGTHSYNSTISPELAVLSTTITLSSTYRDTDNFVRICVTTPTAEIDVSNVTTYYVSIENTSPSGIHVGGKSDIYVYDPEKIMEGTQTLSTSDGRINLTNVEGVVLPLFNVAKIITTVQQTELVEGTDWNLFSENVGNAYSTRDVPYLAISPDYLDIDLDITYRYYSDGVGLQALLDAPENRFIGTDSLGKIMPPALLFVNTLVYSGSLTLDKAYKTIKDYVIGTKTITISEIISKLMAAGATYIDVSTIDISIREWNEQRTLTREVDIVTSYTVPSLHGLYADEYTMTGLTKQ